MEDRVARNRLLFMHFVELAVHQTVVQSLNEFLELCDVSHSNMRNLELAVQTHSTELNFKVNGDDQVSFPSQIVESGLDLCRSEKQADIVLDISFIDFNMFTPGCIICQLQFKHVYRDYVISRDFLGCFEVGLGSFLVTKSHLDPVYLDLGIVTALYSVNEFIQLKQTLGFSLDQEENFIGTVLRPASVEELQYLPTKFQVEKSVHQYARHTVEQLQLSMDVYEVEFQFDGKVLYVYYTADGRVDYREFVAYMKAFTGVRVKMKKTNQCRKFIPRLFASVALATGKLPGSMLSGSTTSGTTL